MNRAPDVLILTGIIAVALLYRLPNMSRGLGQDELFTAVNFVDVEPFWQTMTSNAAFNNHIGYSVAARISQAFAGRTEFALRLPALLFGIASIGIGYACVKALLNRTWAAVFGMVLAVSPAHSLWSVQARGYSAMICLTMLSTCLYLRLRKGPSHGIAIGYVIVSVLATYVHVYGLFVVAVQFAFYLGDRIGVRIVDAPAPHSERLLRRCFVVFAGVSFLLQVPVLRSFGRDLIRRGHGAFDISFPWRLLVELSGIDRPDIAALVVSIAAIGAAALPKLDFTLAIYSGAVLAAPLVLMWLARPFDLYPRFFAYWLPHLMLLFVLGIRAIWNLPVRANAKILARVAAFALLIFVGSEWVAARQIRVVDEGYREASVAALRGAGSSVGFCAIGGARSVWRYYIRQPVATPRDLRELEALANRHAELRCVYYEASWQSGEQREIADFLKARGSQWRVNDQISWFEFRNGRRE